MKRFYKMVIHPAEDECPMVDRMYEEPDCDSCDYCKYIGTFAGKYYVDCTYDEE